MLLAAALVVFSFVGAAAQSKGKKQLSNVGGALLTLAAVVVDVLYSRTVIAQLQKATARVTNASTVLAYWLAIYHGVTFILLAGASSLQTADEEEDDETEKDKAE